MKFYTNVSRIGNYILCREIDGDEHRVIREKYSPTLYVPSKNQTEYKTLDGKYVEPIQPGEMSECREFIDRYSGVSGFSVYGNTDYVYQYIGDNYTEDYDFTKLRVAHIDIETTCEGGFPDVNNPEEKVIVITISFNGVKYVLGLGEFTTPNGEHYECFDNEESLLDAFINLWAERCPDIVTGWNIKFFDIPYLVNRIRRVLDDKAANMLSPFGKLREKNIQRMNRDHLVFQIMGVSVLDYLDLYKTFTYTNQESYRLDHIGHVELDEKKLSYEEFDNIREFYKNDFQKFVEYNIKDVELVEMLEEKLKLLELAVALAYSAQVNYEDVFSQVRTWDAIIYHYLRQHGYVIPQKKVGKKDEQYAGAYVKEPLAGKHDWIVSYDLNSLYPHLIMQYNISPETLISMTEDSRFGIGPENILKGPDDFYGKTCFQNLDKLKSQGYSVAANGTCYDSKSQGFLPALMEKMYKDRKMFKKKMIECEKQKQKDPNNKQLDFEIAKYNNFQLVRKIQLNSAYGAIGNEYFRYYDTRMAEAITLSGQLSIRWIINHLNEFLNKTLETQDVDYVVASDTDSVYLTLGGLVEKFLGDEKDKQKIVDFLAKSSDKIIQPFIDKKYDELCTMMQAYENKMVMEREVIADVGVWTAKKRYMLNVHDSEGIRYETPKMKIMGIETTRSSTPSVVRAELKKAIKIVLTGTEDQMHKFIEKFKSEFHEMEPEDIAFPRSVNGMDRYRDSAMIYRKGTPIAVKGSLVYNHHIKKNGLDGKYSTIMDGEKVKFLYLKQPNPVQDSVISFVSGIPKELDLHRFVNYKSQFEKSFLDPLQNILTVVGWTTEERSSLESLFV